MNVDQREALAREREEHTVELVCPCGGDWTSVVFEGELWTPTCARCGGEGVRA